MLLEDVLLAPIRVLSFCENYGRVDIFFMK